MKKSSIFKISLFLSICTFAYLSYHHYVVQLGLDGNSICEINNQFNCTAAATSRFSEIFGIPIALLGLVFHIVLFCFVFFHKLNLIENSVPLKFTIRSFLGIAALTSLAMGAISFFVLKVYCPFCILSYALSLANILLGWNFVQTSLKSPFAGIQLYFGEYKSHLVSALMIPVIAWITSGIIKQNLGLDKLAELIPEKIAIWKNGPTYTFDNSVGITSQVQNPTHFLVEFADFKCPHCQQASKTIKAFLKSHPNVQFTFKPYPLDGNCNVNMNQKGDNSRCLLAGYTLCAEKNQNLGFQVQNWIFENFEQVYPVSDVKTLLPDIKKDIPDLNTEELHSCAESTETYELIKKSVAEGTQANISGTPTVFMNSKLLPLGNVLGILLESAKH